MKVVKNADEAAELAVFNLDLNESVEKALSTITETASEGGRSTMIIHNRKFGPEHNDGVNVLAERLGELGFVVDDNYDIGGNNYRRIKVIW